MGQIFEMEILTDTHVLKSLVPQNHVFSGWSVFVYVSMWVYFCVPVISINQTQIIAGTPNLVVYVRIICSCYLKLFMKIGQIVCIQKTQKNSNMLRPYYGISLQCSLMYLDYQKYNVMK